jgi:LAO/AO transport system kinase
LPAEPTLAGRVLAGDPRAVARAISVVETEGPEAAALVAALFPRTGRALVVGVTGAPGTGKSTLVDRLVGVLRRDGRRIGVLAVDPSSPFSGGAMLGDRVRMAAHATDAGVFIRSMATRGHLGGLSRATADAVAVLDAAGTDVVIVETVGVGQDEVEIAATADVTIVLLAPGGGDELQALKAGIMEIGDLFVVNKADLPGADRAVQAVAASLALREATPDDWRPPVLRTAATAGTGVDELWAEIQGFLDWSAPRRQGRRRGREDARLRDLLARRFLRHVDEALSDGAFARAVDAVVAREIDPYSAVADLMAQVLASPDRDRR